MPFYRKIMKNRQRREEYMIKDRKDVCLVHKEIWKAIADAYVENVGGVYLKELGYLCHVLASTKNSPGKAAQVLYGRRYRHLVLPIKKGRFYGYYFLWLHKPLIKRCDEYVAQGYRYKFLHRGVDLLKYKKGRQFFKKMPDAIEKRVDVQRSILKR